MLVVIHELGHFVTARLAGVRVLEFGIGFPPRAKVLRSKGETLYTLNWLPIGGFVKLEGEDGDQADDPRSFAAQRLLDASSILVAGVVMNLLLAFVIFTGIALAGDADRSGVRFVEVQPGSPAAAAGSRPGDAIVAVDGQHYEFFSGPSVARRDLRAQPARPSRWASSTPTARDATVAVTLRDPAAIDGRQGRARDHPRAVDFEAYFDGAYDHVRPARRRSQIGAERDGRAALGLIVGGLGDLVASVATNPTAPPPVSGPVGIATQIGDVFWQPGRSARSTSRASCRPTSPS